MAQFNLNDYVQVNERIEKFRSEHPDWALLSEIVYDDGKRIVVKAEIRQPLENGMSIKVATGHAEEIRGEGMVNKTSAVENCETSAWGRALANLGYEVSKSIASRQEMEKVRRMQQQEAGAPKPAGKGVQKVAEIAEKASEIAVKRAQRIHIAAKEAGISEEKLRTRIAKITGGDESAKALNDAQAQQLLKEIEAFKQRQEASVGSPA